jgi:hypothetical protein
MDALKQVVDVRHPVESPLDDLDLIVESLHGTGAQVFLGTDIRYGRIHEGDHYMRFVRFRVRAVSIMPSGLLRSGRSTLALHALISLRADPDIYLAPQDGQVAECDPPVVAIGFVYRTAALVAHCSLDCTLYRHAKQPPAESWWV